MAGHFFTTIENTITGKPVANATMLVYVAGASISGDAITSGTLATIYSDDGVTEVDQDESPITSDSRGFIEFWTNETSVAVEISYDGTAKKAISDVEIVGGSISSDVTALSVRVSALEAFDDTLGTMAVQDADAVAITGGAITGITDLAVADGGTGASDAAGARTSLGLSKRGFSFAILGTAPTADEPLAAWTPPSGETVTFADDFAGCVGKQIGGGTSPASPYALAVEKNGSAVGTITLATDGTVTFATTGTTVSLTGGTDTLAIYGASTPDAAVGYAFTMAGERS